jgi:hypothetical protein
MTKKFFALSAVLCLVASEAAADLVTFNHPHNPAFTPVTREVTPAERDTPAAGGGGAPADGDVYQFLVTTDGDILSINQVQITLANGATLFNNAFGDAANAEPGNPALVAAFPSLGVDSWITTPGTTARLGANLPGDGQTTFGDLTNDGPQSGFMFAQLTVPNNTVGTFTGRVSIASTATPGESFVQPFSFQFGIPEPSTVVMAGMGLIGIVAAGLRRRK